MSYLCVSLPRIFLNHQSVFINLQSTSTNLSPKPQSSPDLLASYIFHSTPKNLSTFFYLWPKFISCYYFSLKTIKLQKDFAQPLLNRPPYQTYFICFWIISSSTSFLRNQFKVLSYLCVSLPTFSFLNHQSVSINLQSTSTNLSPKPYQSPIFVVSLNINFVLDLCKLLLSYLFHLLSISNPWICTYFPIVSSLSPISK